MSGVGRTCSDRTDELIARKLSEMLVEEGFRIKPISDRTKLVKGVRDNVKENPAPEELRRFCCSIVRVDEVPRCDELEVFGEKELFQVLKLRLCLAVELHNGVSIVFLRSTNEVYLKLVENFNNRIHKILLYLFFNRRSR